jgi:alpha-ketoglutarate-dependent taurine dioxygenase
MTTSIATKVKMQAEEIKPQIGARVLNSKEELLSGEIAGEIRELLEARGVLVFPKIGFTSEEQVEFTKTLGTFAPERGDGEGITKITLDAKENPTSAEYLKGSLYWHIDGTRNDVPILASLLSCIVPSPKGTGNTGFANTYSAYDALPEAKKAEYEQYKVIHGPWQSLFYYEPEPSLAKLEGYMAIGEQVLPLVWKHKSGR